MSDAQKKAHAGDNGWGVALWCLFLGGCLFFWPACLDRYLAPRFLFLSVVLLGVIIWRRKALFATREWQLFDYLLLGWAGINFASLGWTFSWSEGLFYAHKTLLLCGIYGVVRYLLQQYEPAFQSGMRAITRAMTGVVAVLIGGQVLWASLEKGIANDHLYQYASGLFGNKSLAAEFLFFLLIFNALFVFPYKKRQSNRLVFGGLLVLILLLQVRTAWLALAAGGLLYLGYRSVFEPDFRQKWRSWYGPTAVFVLGAAAALGYWKSQGGDAAARLNPLNYMESATANERRFVWYKTDLLNAEHYWLGVGNGSWKFWVTSKNVEGGYRQTEQNVVFTRAHNDYLEIRAEMGMAGAVWYCLLFGAAFVLALAGARRRHSSLLAAVGLLGYAIIQYFDFPRERIEFQVILGILFAVAVHDGPGFFKSRISFLQRLAWWALMAGLLFNIYLGWMRVRGEIHLVRLLEAQARSNWRVVIAEAEQAENHLHEYSDAAMPISWYKGVGYFQTGQIEQSVIAFERAYRLHPWSFQVINNYASALVKAGKPEASIPLFEKALAINPRYDEGKFNLAYVYHQLSDRANAEAWLNKVDTIVNPATPADRDKNRLILQKLKEFRKVIGTGE
ncbi:MAG: O-antigen ligase family protein [Saprospiraceae bacterium]|nr:O-antigen ligase family protein [Saprospiraceae bacterium]